MVAIRPRVAATLSAALSAALLVATLTGAARQPAVSDPVQAAFTPPGPYATTTGTVTGASGTAIYDLFYPSNYAALGFKSPIITWGNGTGSAPGKYSVFLSHLASYGFTIIASTLPNTGSGNEIDAAAHYLVAQDTVASSVFHGHLDVDEVAAVGQSQGATGAIRAATNDAALIKTVLTFSLPNSSWAAPNPDCPTAADCTAQPRGADPARLPHRDPRMLGLGRRQPGHREGLLPQHQRPRRARHHPQLRWETGRPRLHPEHRGRRKPGRLPRLRHRLARVPAARQRHRGRRVHRRAPRTDIERQLARRPHQVTRRPAAPRNPGIPGTGTSQLV